MDFRSRETLLIQAVREGDKLAVELLLEFRADPLRQNIHGKSAISLSADRPELLLLLRTTMVRVATAVAEVEGAAGARSGISRPKHSEDGNDKSKPGNSPERENMHFSMADSKDMEESTAEGILNQLDLEESYDHDWTTPKNGKPPSSPDTLSPDNSAH
mmetsp:Transcript_13380/g.30559  ORF Transcript_13380/g.30559 Transcript_13380/m.30559 type:complete len:159 (-) Transcript_13380:116-592(-)